MLRDLLQGLDRFLEVAQRVQKQRALRSLEQSLERAVQKAFRAQGEDFLRRFGGLKSKLPVLEEAIQPSDWEPLFKKSELRTLKLFVAPLEAAAGKALFVGAKRMIADIGLPLSFSLKNPRAVAFLKNYGAERVTKINETTRDVIRGIVSQGTEEGWSYDRMAKEISDRYAEFRVGKPQEHIDSRAHLVAITESAAAYEQGNLVVAQDLQAAGLEMEKAWSTVGDDKVSDGCQENQDAGWIDLDELFPSGHQRPPRHPACRCDALYRRKGSGSESG